MTSSCCARGQKPVKICDGEFGHPVVSGDGKWVVASRSDQGWAKPHSIVRVEVATGKVMEMDLGGRGEGEPYILLEQVGKVLVSHRTREGKETKFYLVDAATGKYEEVQGEFWPLMESGAFRPLQATGRKGEVWAAKMDRRNRETVVGRYDLGKFAFEAVRRVPRLDFSSREMWVDEKECWIYATVNGDLLRVPLAGG